jgi:GNAT superfamily N-acetyltransferase
MASVTEELALTVRAAQPSEGHAIAALWRELWDTHESWGGYPGTKDPHVYEQLADRLSKDARVRASQPVLGRHIHLVAHMNTGLVGQVEGWFERQGIDPTTPFTCEVRSLIVASSARTRGVGTALLTALGHIARHLSRNEPTLLSAEVLEPNPFYAFYINLGYQAVSYNAQIATTAAMDESSLSPEGFTVRTALPSDALALALLEHALAEKRRTRGDMRFDRPRAVEATLVGAIAAHLARTPAQGEPVELVVVDRTGVVRASAGLAVTTLDPPFLPIKRGVIGRFALDPGAHEAPLLRPLLRYAQRSAALRGASLLELHDLDPPGSPIFEAALHAGARPWSRIVVRKV